MNTAPRHHEPRILRTHRLITQGISKEKGDILVRHLAHGLQALSHPQLHMAPPSRSIHELLSQASHIAKEMGPLRIENGTATLNQEAA